MATKTDVTGVDDRYLGTYVYLDQSKTWYPNGRPPVAIADMGAEWRHNAARWLERRAAWFAMAYSYGEILWLSRPTMREVIAHDSERGDIFGRSFSPLDLMSETVADMFDAEDDRRARDPLAWLKTTPLYRALIDGVPIDDPALAARARHYAGCPQREQTGADCDCVRLAAAVAHEAEITNGTPEWTDD